MLVEHGTLFGELPAGGYDQITANPEGGEEAEAILEDVAMESGTD